MPPLVNSNELLKHATDVINVINDGRDVFIAVRSFFCLFGSRAGDRKCVFHQRESNSVLYGYSAWKDFLEHAFGSIYEIHMKRNDY